MKRRISRIRSTKMASPNQGHGSLRLIRFILYALGFLSLALVMFMAHRLESKSNEFKIIPGKRKTSVELPVFSKDFFSQSAMEYYVEERSLADEIGFQKIDVELDPKDANVVRVKAAQEEALSKKQESLSAQPQQGKVDARLFDPRLADNSAVQSVSAQQEAKGAVVDSSKAAAEGGSVATTIESVADANAVKPNATDGENVLVVIISNRRDGIIPTLASILRTSTKPVDVVLIGEHDINLQVSAHFGSRINEFKSLSVKDIENDLVAQGFNPIWTWPEWHTTMDPSWRNENTLHVGSWDNLHTHAHELNHLRFYLPHVTVFQTKRYFYFLDDDLLVHQDLGVLAQLTMDDLDPTRGLVCPCNIWMWNSECFHFEFQSKKDYILSMPSLYGDREVCKTDSESHCVPANYWSFVEGLLPAGGKDQHAWNFGFSLFALKHWRDLKLTEMYEKVMKESYRLHVFPETSLTFGLGVAYIAFAGAVECWNENIVEVRDGFGFIEWDRYAQTFGEDFYKKVSVAHYTGPDKPWVNESRIEVRAIDPWLKMMEKEGMPIPKQLPVEPTNNLFTLMGSDRTGAQWIMSTLDAHPEVCASGETDKPETGFPADVLLPDGLPWYPYCSIKRGCTYEFVSKMVVELMADSNDGIPRRCAAGYDAAASNDELVGHLTRLCNFVKKLDGKLDGGNVARVWVDAFIQEDRTLLGCGCVRGVKAKGLKVKAEWILPKGYPFVASGPVDVDLTNTKVKGNKIIRLKRKNLWARYKSMLMAQQTGMYHPTTPAEKKTQMASLKDIEVEVEHMEWNMKHMEAIDKAGDEWAEKHASEVLWLDYDDCRARTAECFTKIYDFIGVDSTLVTGKKASQYESSFATFSSTDSTMDFIKNKGEIKELLGINGWDHFMTNDKYLPIQFLTYEENDILADSRRYMGINASLFGQDHTANGYGNKYSAVLPLLKQMDPETLVVLSNDRDGRVNFPVGDHEAMFEFLYSFRKRFDDITTKFPGAVVAATESDCCVSALSHASPGAYIDTNGERKVRACFSGDTDCLWAGDEKAKPWEAFMKELASKRTEPSTETIYLDSSLLAGRAVDLLKLVSALSIVGKEDDRAVLTDYMFRNPELLVLDYEQHLMGESRKLPFSSAKKGCFAATSEVAVTSRRLDTVAGDTQPLFIYSPRDLGCGDVEKKLAPKYPIWDKNGIVLKPILEHVNRVVEMTESIVLPPAYGRKPDYRQGPEVPYIFDEKGVWSSKLIRDRTNNETFHWRMAPTEGLTKVAHEVLMRDDPNSSRWSRLKASVRSGGFPYWAWYGDFKTCNYQNYDKDSIPLFTTCAMASCSHAFPMPNYMTIIDTQQTDENWRGVFKEFNKQHLWESKIRKVAWRGALSEAEWRDALTSVRWRVAKLVHESKSDLYDIGLTSIPSWLTDKIQFNMTEIGGFAKGISPMSAFQEYIAILDMDGNSWSSRFGSLLCYNSVVIKVEPKYFDYFYSDLKPWTHFIPVKNDLSDFEAHVAWTLDPKNEQAVKSIITSANQWCSQRLVPSELATDLLDIFESYVRLLDRQDPQWRLIWQQTKESLLQSTKLSLFRL